ncbi:Polyadenylate-binding protein 3 [Cardamine amara subsp. amara]|uniref:Polyadenylate-binding protein 3 n=1 Tax=Cardamine amara subsp. amara TaxID=228776 RepID=A0ABD1AK39_CARAN
MAEAVDSLTFPMSRESESASRLKTIISDILPHFFDDYSDGVLPEYITMLVCNGKSQRQAIENLEAFLGEQSWEFVACLWELLIKDFSRGKQENSASQPKTAVDSGPHDIKQDLSSTRHDDYDHEATTSMNEKLIAVTAPIEDVEAPVLPKVEKMKMLRQELIGSPCRRAQPKEKEDWNSSGYSTKILRSAIVSAIKQPCGRNPDKYEKSMDERRGTLQKRLNWAERDMGSQSVSSGGAVSARSYDAASHQEMRPRLSVWDRLERPDSIVLDIEYPPLPKFRMPHENKVFQQHGPAFPAAYSEQHSKTFHREVPTVGYRHRVFQSHKARQPKSGTITSTEPHTAYNLSRKRRYGMIEPNSGEFSIGLQYKQAKQDVEKPSLLSSQFTKPDIFSEIKNMKEKLQQLELRIKQSKQMKKKKVEELKCSPQSGELQYQQDLSESRAIYVTNVHYAAKKEAISMLFSKCGAVTDVKVVNDSVTRHPKGAAFVTFATKESVNKAIALSGTMFYSRPIKVWRHVKLE